MAAPIEKVTNSLNIQLKPQQLDILQCLLDRKDCMAVLPTGFGKSLPYQLLPLVQREIGHTGIVLVCCPLVSLMKDQVERINAIKGVTAAYKGQGLDKEILSGEVDIIFGSPESLLGEWRAELQQLNVTAIVIDEFHLISTWGQDDEHIHKRAFRKWFGDLGELRSIFPNASLLALSATCTLKVQKRVLKVVSFKPDFTFVYLSPDKRNIKYVVKKVANDIEMAMTWLVDGLVNMGSLFPRTLIYCKSISDVAKIYDYVSDELPEDLCSYIAMYHSETEESIKETVLLSIREKESPIRVIVSTNALGMGVDFKDLHSIILFGPPHSILEVVQEIGRAGRDGEKSVSLLLYNSHHLARCGPEVKKLFKSNDCRRIQMMESFLKESELDKVKSYAGNCSCCDVCQNNCLCGDCSQLPLEKLFLGNHVTFPNDHETSEDSDS
ncbi:ATP-dependent DNA helicase RecQ-like [Saccostrea echinata]|uniref:ATP-dependent DNA helicase RecQ-like n=2 Tax=Saccostrea echinata TaxID=191078 RepID=UPI002A7FD1BF|nr:ATP-dependent DNA helicase RecQ-like [Saccostrea echinata]